MRSRAGNLLGALAREGEMTLDELSRELGIPVPHLEDVLSGDAAMSLPHQLAFADLLVERIPRLAREGHALRAQALAATAYAEGRTEVHSYPPPAMSVLRRRGRSGA